jgi:hypothetical protein
VIDTDTRLAELRGPLPPKGYDARKITALTANPGCDRRSLLDAAGVDKVELAMRLGAAGGYGQSPFALGRGTAFEALVKADGYAELISLLRAELAVSVNEASVEDLNANPVTESLRERSVRTRRILGHVADDSETRTILDHPVLTLEVAGSTAYLETDAVTHRIGGRFYLVEIKSFAAIDGQADPAQVAQATKQAAVYVLALRRTLASLGHDPALVADQYLLVCPKDFANRPFGRLVDLRQQYDAVGFQIDRLRRVPQIAQSLPAGATFDLSRDVDGKPARSEAELEESLSALPAWYRPECLSSCDMAMYCRGEATRAAQTARLGSSLRDVLPGIGSTDTALKLIDGRLPRSEHNSEVVDLIQAADSLRRRRMRGAA